MPGEKEKRSERRLEKMKGNEEKKKRNKRFGKEKREIRTNEILVTFQEPINW